MLQLCHHFSTQSTHGLYKAPLHQSDVNMPRQMAWVTWHVRWPDHGMVDGVSVSDVVHGYTARCADGLRILDAVSCGLHVDVRGS